jgi:hypothetical protein
MLLIGHRLCKRLGSVDMNKLPFQGALVMYAYCGIVSVVVRKRCRFEFAIS